MLDPIKIYNRYVKKEAEENKEARKIKNEGYLEASSAGMCHKKHYYRMIGATPKDIQLSSLKIMRLGTIMGQDFEDSMRDWICSEENICSDEESYKRPNSEQIGRYKVYMEDFLQSNRLMVGGHMDLMIVDTTTGKARVWDWKTANSFKYKMVFNGGFGNPSTNYELQVATYGLLAIENGLCTEIEHLGLLYYNKDNSIIKEKVVPLEYMEKCENYWLDINKDGIEPNFGLGKVPVYKWECGKYCNYSNICGSPYNTK